MTLQRNYVHDVDKLSWGCRNSPGTFGLLYATLTLFSTVLFLLGATHVNRWRLTKPYGIVLLVGYVVVLIFCSCYELNLFSNVHPPACPLVE
ncbi:unnamed protein product [Echinostoma caproni]|uniref:Frizzled-4 n=1 Tax=Echinostoma caproni TaxID=27848 RepID=A0A183AWA8_9TREM|nr:unnamed protein product [Echinostoma caproni]